jgi:integrase
MGLGPVSLARNDGAVSLAEAREAAHECHRLLRDGVDPIAARQKQREVARVEQAKGLTFEACAEAYIDAHEVGWRNEKHKHQWRATLTNYAVPKFGKLPVAEIDTGLVMKAVEPIWREKPETASRLRGRIESVLDWATVRGYRAGDNPARWRGHLAHLLPHREKVRAVRHHPAMAYVEVPAFLGEICDVEGMSARALEFTILTAARTGEAIGARWDELDLDARVWTVPAERTKSGREHRVPLSGRALEIVQSLAREPDNPFVFPGARRGRSLSNMAMLQLLRRQRPGLTCHGFRASFRMWAAETTNFPREVVEAALAHVLADKTEAAYQRGDVFEKRRKLMGAWAGYCACIASGDVVPILARKPA